MSTIAPPLDESAGPPLDGMPEPELESAGFWIRAGARLVSDELLGENIDCIEYTSVDPRGSGCDRSSQPR